MGNELFNRIKAEIKAELPYIINNNGLGRAGKFTTSAGGEFACPSCGKTVKLYKNKKGNWAINTLANCACFENGGYSADSFGVTAALQNRDEKEVFRSMMEARGFSFSSSEKAEEKSPEEVARLEARRAELARQAEERERVNAEEQARRDGIKALNADLLMTSTVWGLAMPAEAIDLLFKRGIDPIMLPAGVTERIGYVKASGFRCLDKDGTYSTEGIVFRVGEKAGQVRRTAGENYIGKESKMARFQTFGVAEPYLLDFVTEEMSKATNGSESTIYITEGPFDALAALEGGATFAIAALGAGNHHYIIERLKDYKGNIMICFDTDSAGRQCGASLADSLQRQGNKAFVLKLSGKEHDINDLLQADREGLEKRIELVELTAVEAPDDMQRVCNIIGSSAIIGDKHIDKQLREKRLSRRMHLKKDVRHEL